MLESYTFFLIKCKKNEYNEQQTVMSRFRRGRGQFFFL